MMTSSRNLFVLLAQHFSCIVFAFILSTPIRTATAYDITDLNNDTMLDTRMHNEDELSNPLSDNNLTDSEPHGGVKNLTVIYLASFRLKGPSRKGRIISGAMSYAVARINADSTLLSGWSIRFVPVESGSDPLVGAREMSYRWRDGAVAFFGPEDSCEVEGRLASAWNLPLFAYKCASAEVSDKILYPTVIRTSPPAAQVTKSIVSLLLHFNWKRFTIIAGSAPEWLSIAKQLETMARQLNMTINNRVDYKEELVRKRKNFGDRMSEIVEATHINTRVYVFLGKNSAMISLMEKLDRSGLLSGGQYVIIHTDLDNFSRVNPLVYFNGGYVIIPQRCIRCTEANPHDGSKRYSTIRCRDSVLMSLGNPGDTCSWFTQNHGCQLLRRDNCRQHRPDEYSLPNEQMNVEAARSLLVIVPSSPDDLDHHVRFRNEVNRYNALPPFNFRHLQFMPMEVSPYAEYLFDAVTLYAESLGKVLKQGGSVTDGKTIADFIRGRTYFSMQGFMSHIDENGDAEGNYTVLSRSRSDVQFDNPMFAVENNSYSYAMLPVGRFIMNGSGAESIAWLPEFVLFKNKSIDWPGDGLPPVDMPPCGYRGELCLVDSNYLKEKLLGVFAGVCLVALIIGTIAYRNWRYEQEIAGLLWRINLDDVHWFGTTGLHGSRSTLMSAQGSCGEGSYNQLFTRIGRYRGQVVAIKRCIRRGTDLTRAAKKEMKLMREMRHDNVNAFIGACSDPPDLILLTEYCAKGSLQDILENDDVKLDSMFIASLVMDLIKGMSFIHDSELRVHGNLKSSNCVVNSRWTLQVVDFGLTSLRQTVWATDDEEDDRENERIFYRNQFWTAPELLRDYVMAGGTTLPRSGTQKGDVYSFGIVLYEILSRTGPYADINLSPADIIRRVKHQMLGKPCFRPDLSAIDCQDYVSACMQDCWHENPTVRPDFRTIRSRLKPMMQGMKPNILDNMLAMMEKYQLQLEDLVAERTDQLIDEKKKTEGLLLRMLPKSVVEELVQGKAASPESFSSVTVYFSDICGFTALSAESTPMQVVNLLNDLYTLFDSVICHYDVYKVETIGDAYMVVSGLPIRNGDCHAGEIASMALALLESIRSFKIRYRPDETVKLRIGIHSGSCVAGVVGLTMPRYCLFGDTVNTASRMESNGEPLKIHVSDQCKQLLDRLGGYTTMPRGCVAMKGKGEQFTHWLVAEDRSIRAARRVAQGVPLGPQDGPSSIGASRSGTAGGERKISTPLPSIRINDGNENCDATSTKNAAFTNQQQQQQRSQAQQQQQLQQKLVSQNFLDLLRGGVDVSTTDSGPSGTTGRSGNRFGGGVHRTCSFVHRSPSQLPADGGAGGQRRKSNCSGNNSAATTNSMTSSCKPGPGANNISPSASYGWANLAASTSSRRRSSSLRMSPDCLPNGAPPELMEIGGDDGRGSNELEQDPAKEPLMDCGDDSEKRQEQVCTRVNDDEVFGQSRVERRVRDWAETS